MEASVLGRASTACCIGPIDPELAPVHLELMLCMREKEVNLLGRPYFKASSLWGKISRHSSRQSHSEAPLHVITGLRMALSS